MKRSIITAALLISMTVGANANSHDFIVSQASRFGIARSVIEKIARRESMFTCSPHNRTYMGPLQILPSTARFLGYRGSASGLNNCGAGLFYGLKHVAMCVGRYGNNPGAVTMCHARGH